MRFGFWIEPLIFNPSLAKRVKLGSNVVKIGATSILVDAHVHLSDPLLQNRVEQITLFLKASGTKVCSVSTDIASSRTALVIANTLGTFGYTFIGIHPQQCATESKEEFLKFFTKNLKRIDGIGEIGLDGTYSQDSTFLKMQDGMFEYMLGLAEKHSFPISVHSRGATSKTIDTLGKYDLKGVLLHWFSGTEQELSRANSKGYYVSFGPSVVYSKRFQKLARNAAKDLILIETDGPVSYGACFGGRMADPTFLASVWNSLAMAIGAKHDELEHRLDSNFSSYIGRSKG